MASALHWLGQVTLEPPPQNGEGNDLLTIRLLKLQGAARNAASSY